MQRYSDAGTGIVIQSSMLDGSHLSNFEVGLREYLVVINSLVMSCKPDFHKHK